ncbi:MAG: replication initiation protein [Acutalibacteraceae bacterium]|nr:replication initiation protein [Acutalibacteraceae bacterium]
MIKKYQAVISNCLIRDICSADDGKMIFSVTEYRIIFMLISLIKKIDVQFRTFNISIAEFCEYWEISYGGNQAKNISDTVKSLCEKEYIVNNKTVRFLDDNSYITDGIMHLKLDDSLLGFLFNLNADFTIIDVEYLVKLKSRYSVRIYLYLKSLESQKYYNIGLENAFTAFSDNKYKTKSQLKKLVVDKAIKDINISTDIIVSVKFNKVFGYGDKLSFFINKKVKKPKPTINQIQMNSPKINIYVDADDYATINYDYGELDIDEDFLPF